MEITISDVVFKYIEFFFSKEELLTMFKIKPLSYHVWLNAVHGLYSVDPNLSKPANEKVFHYNIMHTSAYKDIIEILKKIKGIVNDSAKFATTTTDENAISKNKTDGIDKIKVEYDQINKLCIKDLYYYEETYIYAHYVFNNIRNNGIKIKGGGLMNIKDIKDMSLEDFKDAIREKIKELDLGL